MRRNRYAPAIWMAVTLMRSGLANERKTIAFKGGDQFASS
jgi:hypothetical protein